MDTNPLGPDKVKVEVDSRLNTLPIPVKGKRGLFDEVLNPGLSEQVLEAGVQQQDDVLSMEQSYHCFVSGSGVFVWIRFISMKVLLKFRKKL